MLSNKAKNSSLQADLGSSAKNIPDPWTTPSKVQKPEPVTKIGYLSTETSPLISLAGSPDTPKIASHQSTSEEILLEDELKLKTNAGSLLKQQLEKALALLYWWKK